MKYWKRVCFYCTSFLSLTCRHYSNSGISGSSHSDKRRMFLKWSFGEVWRHVMWKRLFLWRTRCIGDFLYFCKRCLALIFCLSGVPVYVVLHEANVAVDFSFSSLSLCDIVYWEKCEVFIWVFYFKRGYCDTVWYCHLSWRCPQTDFGKALPFFTLCCFFMNWFWCSWTEVGSTIKLYFYFKE